MHYGMLFVRESGKIRKTLSEEYGCAFLKMWGLNNTTPTTDFIVFDEESGIIEAYYVGKKNDMPNIEYDMNGKNIEELCPGMLEELAKMKGEHE